MKKNLFLILLGFTAIFFTAGCSKSDTAIATSVEGKWVGNSTSGIGGPVYYLALNFKTAGVVTVEANNSAAPDLASGTWSLVGDSVRATFTYTAGTMSTFSLAGKYSSNSNVMTGTIGNGASSSGTGTFSVTKQ